MKKSLKQSLHCQTKRGFTLIELIVTVFIASVLIGVFSMLVDFSFKNLEYSYTVNDNIYSGIHLFGLINDDVVKSEVVYDSSEFILNENYSCNLGFVLRIRDKSNYKYVYYAYKDSNIWRIAFNTAESDPKKISFKSLKDKGVNSIIENVVSIDGSRLNTESKLIDLVVEVNNSKKDLYTTQIYAQRVDSP